MKNIFIFTLLFMVPNLVLAEEKELYATITDNQPERGVENERYLGDRMLAQRVGQWKECIVPLRTFERSANMGAARVTHKADEPLCKRSASDKKDRYWPNYVNWTPNFTYEVRWTPKKNKSKLCICSAGFCMACVKKIDENDVDESIAFVYQPNSLQQLIEYTGSNDNLLTFTYSEFRDGYAREAFNREFQVDLDKGNIVAFKGAILEIIEATNISIRYKVIRNFQST